MVQSFSLFVALAPVLCFAVKNNKHHSTWGQGIFADEGSEPIETYNGAEDGEDLPTIDEAIKIAREASSDGEIRYQDSPSSIWLLCALALVAGVYAKTNPEKAQEMKEASVNKVRTWAEWALEQDQVQQAMAALGVKNAQLEALGVNMSSSKCERFLDGAEAVEGPALDPRLEKTLEAACNFTEAKEDDDDLLDDAAPDLASAEPTPVTEAGNAADLLDMNLFKCTRDRRRLH